MTKEKDKKRGENNLWQITGIIDTNMKLVLENQNQNMSQLESHILRKKAKLQAKKQKNHKLRDN